MGRGVSWVRTLVAQIAICLALYLSLNLGRPQKSLYANTRSESESENENENEKRPLDLHFVSVRGGSRPLHQQALLLKQMNKVVKAFKARLVLNIGELGEHDPLIQNATQLFPSRKVPWYNTRASRVHQEGGFSLKRVNITSSSAKTLDIIIVDTGLIQDVTARPLNETVNNQLNWLKTTLEATNCNWRIVVGFDPLVTCRGRNDGVETNSVSKALQQLFMNFEVNAYISSKDCRNDGTISYIENPGQSSLSDRSEFQGEFKDGFLLHRVSALELVTYFVTTGGEVVHRSALLQRRTEVI